MKKYKVTNNLERDADFVIETLGASNCGCGCHNAKFANKFCAYCQCKHKPTACGFRCVHDTSEDFEIFRELAIAAIRKLPTTQASWSSDHEVVDTCDVYKALRDIGAITKK